MDHWRISSRERGYQPPYAVITDETDSKNGRLGDVQVQIFVEIHT